MGMVVSSLSPDPSNISPLHTEWFVEVALWLPLPLWKSTSSKKNQLKSLCFGHFRWKKWNKHKQQLTAIATVASKAEPMNKRHCGSVQQLILMVLYSPTRWTDSNLFDLENTPKMWQFLLLNHICRTNTIVDIYRHEYRLTDRWKKSVVRTKLGLCLPSLRWQQMFYVSAAWVVSFTTDGAHNAKHIR